MNSKYRFLLGVLFATLLGGFTACSRHPSVSSMSEAGKTLYHCAMHPQIVSDKPGECPICHMRLEPFQPSSEASSTPSTAIPGHAAVQMTPEVQQRIGVTVAPAELHELNVPIRAAARVAYDPDLYSALMEHQEARRFLEKAKDQDQAELLEQAEATVRSSKLRLHQMGLSEGQIAEMGRSGYDISDLLPGAEGGQVWVYIDVSADRMGLVKPGQKVELESPALADGSYTGRVQSVDTILNADSRTLRVRARVANPRGALKPEMFLSATIEAALGRRLAVPESAVVDTGARQLVYVEKSPGFFEPRDVKLGQLADGYDEILAGLQPAEKVVTSANFLVDSESRIQAAAQAAR